MYKVKLFISCGGGHVVSLLAYYSDDPSSNPADVYNLYLEKMLEINEIIRKRGR